MRRHRAYLGYVLRHKWYVLCACYSLDVPLWRAVIHDWSKFLPCEWFPYARTFFASDGTRHYKPDPGFKFAWLHHQKMNPHHWQYWVQCKDGGLSVALPMPETYIREMVADWVGAGIAINGKMEVDSWYAENRDKMIFDEGVRHHVDYLVAQVTAGWRKVNA